LLALLVRLQVLQLLEVAIVEGEGFLSLESNGDGVGVDLGALNRVLLVDLLE